MEYRKNDCVTVTIEDMGSDGEGIGKVDGFTLFVKDAVLGDTVEAKIVKSKKSYAYARLEKVVTPSPFRVEPKCAYHRQCGGCQLQTLSYEKQLEFKQQKIRNNLIRIGGFAPEYIDEKIEPIIGMEAPFHYRNKAQYPVGADKDGNVITGFYAGRTHSIIANTQCHLGASENQEVLEIILDHMRLYNVTPYNETTGEGLVRHILIRKGFTSGEIMVCLVINGVRGINGSKGNNGISGIGESNRNSGRVSKSNSINRASGIDKLNRHHNDTVLQRKNGKEKDYLNSSLEFLPKQDILLEKLSSVKGMTSVSVSINAERSNAIMGKEIYTIWGSPMISDTIHVRDMQKEGYPFTGKELTFHISPLSFYQVNPVQTEKLYSLALEYAGLTGQETVWDLYCGIGTISLFLACSAKQVYGVEIIPQAIEDAKENAKRNGIQNAQFFVGKAEEVLPGFYERQGEWGVSAAAGGMAGAADAVYAVEEKTLSEIGTGSVSEESKFGLSLAADMLHPDVIVVDPPRKGCDQACLDTILKMQPKRIVYVSCDSATLARDLKVLCDGGYEVKKVRGVDQFGMTVHVETVCLLSKLNVKHHIEVELNLDEMDLTVAESKATYEEIKAYVKELTGLQVSNLYIAQVKRKFGIIERVNYNLPKSEDSRQPKCPPEKEEAIKAALEYFRMI